MGISTAIRWARKNFHMLLNFLIFFSYPNFILNTEINEEIKPNNATIETLFEQKILSSKIRLILRKIGKKSFEKINLEPKEAFYLFTVGLDSFFDMKEKVILALIKYFAFDERSYVKLFLIYFEKFKFDYLHDNSLHLRNEIKKVIKNMEYDKIPKIRRYICNFLNETTSSGGPIPFRSRNFESFSSEFEFFIQKKLQINYLSR